MNIVIGIVVIALGLFAIFYLSPKSKSNVQEMKFMQTKKVSELKDMFDQMGSSGYGDDYREYVELKGNVAVDSPAEAPFSNSQVAYCEAKLSQVVEIKEEYRDQNGNRRVRTRKVENEISNEKTSQDVKLNDGTGEVVVEINATGCKLDIPTTFDRFEQRNNLGGYRYFRNFSFNRFGADTLGFKMTEKVIKMNQNLYVIGEAFKVGDTIHIGKPMDDKKPFIVTTKSEEDMINSSKSNATMMLIGGIVAIIAGIVIMFVAK